jgi:multicomponent Na+:H+ antiporter subunit C
MEVFLAILVGVLFAGGIYCLLRRSVIRLIIGMILVSQGANLLVFVSAGIQKGEPPVIEAAAQTLEQPYADPLPQALVLTAIVIGFGFIAFALSLVYRAHKDLGNDDLNTYDRTEQ